MTLQVTGVSYRYAAEPALDRISFAAPAAGSVIALTGPNGSGKSTLLKIIARVLAPESGEVVVDGRPASLWSAREYARHVGYLPQDAETVFPMKAIDVVVSGRAPFLSRFGWESDLDYVAAERALKLCDAAHLADRFLDEMSGGERKRIFLARVLAGDPRLILLDEPFASLDVAHLQQVSRLLRRIAIEMNSTILFASHDLNWAAAYSDRMLVMQRGTMAIDGVPAEVMRADVVRELFDFDADTVVSGGRTWLVPR